MRKSDLAAFLVLSAAFLFPRLATAAPERERKPDLIVDDDKVQCPTATFTSIQDAINAAKPGNVIRVCAGTYHEQLVVNESLSIEADNGAVLQPGTMAANAVGTGGEPIAAAILVKEASNVRIAGLIVDTANNGINQCSPFLIGILYQNSSGSIQHNAVRNVKLPDSLNGCQSGDAIVVQTIGGETATVTIEDNSVHDYQKNGITGNESGTDVAVTNNVVTGLGPTTGAAQNGIQIGFGAKGRVAGNTVTDNVWSPCVSLDACAFNATGILIFQSDGVRVENNAVATNQIGVYANGQQDDIESNTVSNSLILTGIDLAGDNGVAHRNDVTNSGQAGIVVEGNNNSVRANEINEAPIGILELSGTVGNAQAGNSFFNTLVPVQDPAPTHAIHVSPRR